MFSVPESRLLFGLIPWYSFLIVVGAALAVWLAAREEKHVSLPKDTILDLALWVLPFGILGARLYYVLFSWPEYRGNPISVLYIWQGGLAIYGGLLAGLLVILLFCRARKLRFLLLCDIIAPGVALAQALGRWGNYFNMEAYGAEITVPALCFFPLAVQIPADGVYHWHIATFFLESLWDFLLFCFLLRARRSLLRCRGDVFLFYVFGYACGRLVIEECRMDSLYASGIRVSQLLSLLAILFLLVLLFRRERSRPHPTLAAGQAASVLTLVLAVPVLLYTLHISPFSGLIPALSGRLALLSLFSIFSLLSLFLLYGRSAPSEVLYANHPD